MFGIKIIIIKANNGALLFSPFNKNRNFMKKRKKRKRKQNLSK